MLLYSLWSDYQLTVSQVARLQDEDASLDMIQSQVDAVRQTVAAVGDATSVYSVWNYLSDQVSHINNSLQTTSTQVVPY